MDPMTKLFTIFGISFVMNMSSSFARVIRVKASFLKVISSAEAVFLCTKLDGVLEPQ